MRLSDMSFEESYNAELQIAPIADRILADEETKHLFDHFYGTQDGERHNNAHLSITRLIRVHYHDLCEILAILNACKTEDIKKQNRGEINEQLGEMMLDGDMMSFFLSSDCLAQAVQSAI